MKFVKNIITLSFLATVIAVPLSSGSSVFAWSNNLHCFNTQDSMSVQVCDLAIDKQVSVNGSAFVDAPTSTTAVQAHVGDSVIWKVIVSNNSSVGLTPKGSVTVSDVVPTGLSNVTTSASEETFTNGKWTFGLHDGLPATLTITSTASTLGLIENSAALTGYIYCQDTNVDSVDSSAQVSCGHPYVDDVKSNNASNAFINVVAVPVIPAPVTPAPAVKAVVKAPNTGFGVLNASPVSAVLGYGLVAAAFFGFAYVTRRFVKQ
jgi:uncharacterized repeat protein (TIGR01451 family)